MKYVYKLGVPEGWAFHDVYDLSEDGLKAVPRPLLALLLLFPVKVPHEGVAWGGLILSIFFIVVSLVVFMSSISVIFFLAKFCC